MPKIKLTKGELKRQRDALRQYERYLPTLQLKKQQLQLEIVTQYGRLNAAQGALAAKKAAAQRWAGLLGEAPQELRGWLVPHERLSASRNIAGVDIPVLQEIRFAPAEYDLFLSPLWLDAGIEELRAMVRVREELRMLQEGLDILKRELRVTTQRVNLFEKVKIPEAKEAIRLIKIHIGDQMANAVGRSKIAKRKIEAGDLAEAAA